MSDNKELLEATVKGLQEKIQQLNTDYKNKLQELEDINKPVIQASQMDVIDNGIQKTFENFDLDIEQFDYEGRVNLSHININCTYELIETIVERVHNLFKEIKDDK